MTAKEKAQHLVTAFKYQLLYSGVPLREFKNEMAKKCVLIVIDEIKAHCSQVGVDYWIEVEKELGNI